MPSMDFRDNWFDHFKAAVDSEQAAGMSLSDAYLAASKKLEMSRDTVYQHYQRKSKKVYPTVEMMVMVEKKYGNGRPIGWASLPLGAIEPGTVRLKQEDETVEWPFGEITATELSTLSPLMRAELQGYIRGMLSTSGRNSPTGVTNVIRGKVRVTQEDEQAFQRTQRAENHHPTRATGKARPDK